jgi:hypothetical protein
MRAMILCLALGSGILQAERGLADDPPAEAAADAPAPTEPESEAPAEDAAKPESAAFVPPDGWRPRKRGQFTVYCRKQVPMGSRMPTEVCYDEDGIRAMLAAQTDDRERADQ